MATHYGLEGPEFDPRWDKVLSFRQNPSRLALGTGLFPEVKRRGHGVRIVEIHLHCSSVSSRHGMRRLYLLTASYWYVILEVNLEPGTVKISQL